jgi:hypothetical protein
MTGLLDPVGFAVNTDPSAPMKHRHQKLMAVVMVTAALCADQAVATAPSARPAVGHIASRFVDRLTRNLGRAVQTVKLHQDRAENERPSLLVTAEPAESPAIDPQLSPLKHRLPPPLV